MWVFRPSIKMRRPSPTGFLAMDELRASGQLDKILAKYGMTDWRNQPTN